ncbi:hypothetical protein C8Q78DRAFT_1078563 [Trametes maxima]|nr:hypothetical protein C8Q78DRAFT_1078563 [Trametes maxima]
MQPAQHAEQAPRPTIAVSVLRAHYVVVESLQKYIENTVYAEDISSILVHGGDSDYYRVMLTTSYVAGGASLQQTRQFVPVAPMSHMRDTIDRAQERLFIRAKGSRPSNILTAGYRKITQQDTRARVAATRMPLTNYFVNTIVTALQAPAWETLLERYSTVSCMSFTAGY